MDALVNWSVPIDLDHPWNVFWLLIILLGLQQYISATLRLLLWLCNRILEFAMYITGYPKNDC
jgi:hypothetical protein